MDSYGMANYEDILSRLGDLEDKFDFVLNLGKHHKELEILDPMNSDYVKADFEILIKPKSYFKMAMHAFKFANKNIPKIEWVEVIGLLTGKVENKDTPLERIVVEDYWPIGAGDAVSVNILNAEPVMKVYKNKPEGHFIVGWAHSHPSYTPFLSEDDVATQSRYQALWEDSLAIVIDPELINSNNYGFSIFRLTASRDEYYEVKCEIEGMTAPASFDALSVFLHDYGLDII